MNTRNHRIILASGSPRRKELLQGLDIEFEVDTQNNFKEYFDPSTPHVKVPELMSVGKSHGFYRPLEDNEILITSDTMVLMDKMILGKPHSREEAYNMLHSLSGHTHEVITAVTIRDRFEEETFSDTTFVTFKEFSDEEINYYIETYKPFDKAGAYGIQEWIGYIGTTEIKGSFFNVMGFPVHRVYTVLQKFIAK